MTCNCESTMDEQHWLLLWQKPLALFTLKGPLLTEISLGQGMVT